MTLLLKDIQAIKTSATHPKEHVQEKIKTELANPDSSGKTVLRWSWQVVESINNMNKQTETTPFLQARLTVSYYLHSFLHVLASVFLDVVV